jgi:redox-sensitive bicupin YhaK (pirin superfamily)
MKTIERISAAASSHWVGDGFPVRPLFSYQREAAENSPFLMLDYAGPYNFTPTTAQRGVGTHPHRGFETVTIVYDGEVSHRDSAGHGGTIGPGDVQWMTAAGGVLHQEYHSAAFRKTGGPFRMVQLWVNLQARDKMSKPGYQSILKADIPIVALPAAAGDLRVIAGDYAGAKGAARTFTPMNIWDVKLKADAEVTLPAPAGHTTLVNVLSGHITLDNGETAGEATLVRFSRDGEGLHLKANGDTTLLVLTGTPIDEPVVGYGPFVMNSMAEIRQAVDDVNSGRFGEISETAA